MSQGERRAGGHAHGLPLQRRDQLLAGDVGRIALCGKEVHQPITHTTALVAPVDGAAEVRNRLSGNGVSGLTREEVGEPIGNTLNHNLIRELMESTTLVPPDLRILDHDG